MPTSSNSGNSKTHRLLSRSAARLRWRHLGYHFFNAAMVVAILLVILILVTRLTSSLPPSFASYPILAAIPLIALTVAWFTHPRVTASQAAAVVDQHQKNHDLFLTTVHLDGSAGGYQSKVLERAESLANKGVPLSVVVPWPWKRRAGILALTVALLATGIAFLPQLDPFGKQEQRDWLGKQEGRLDKLRKETQLAASTRRPEDMAERAENVQQALTDLEKTFRNAKPENKQDTADKLSQKQKELNKFWKQLNDEKLGKALAQANNQLQQFGQSDSADPKVREFREKLRQLLDEGDTKAIQEALSKLLQKAEDMQQAAKAGSSQEKQQQQQQGVKELRHAMQDLAEAVSKEAQAPQVDQALQRAIEQLQTAQNGDLSEQALQDAQESIKNLEQQLKDLGEQLKQLEALEQALEAGQLAQQLNELGKLGKGTGATGKGMKDYKQLYQEMLDQMQQGGGAQMAGNGPGGGGPGQGKGATAPEDDSGDTDFKTEQSKSTLVAGKMLMEWKTKGVSETGNVTQKFGDSVRTIKQGISEAIRNEQIPPGYHDQIKRYFDTLPEVPVSTENLD